MRPTSRSLTARCGYPLTTWVEASVVDVSHSSSKIQEKADNALAIVETDTKDIAARISDASSTLVKFVDGRKNAVEGCVRDLRDVSSLFLAQSTS